MALQIIVVMVVFLMVVLGWGYLSRVGWRDSKSKHDPLLTACLGDHKKTRRLIDYEKKLNPVLSESDARASALDRLRQDRGR